MEKPRDLSAPAIVIAHGAWADATNWREVIALLHAKGLLVVAVQSPLTGLADDVDAVTRALNHQSHPVVLVGHDYGGTVITQAGRHQTVAGAPNSAWAFNRACTQCHPAVHGSNHPSGVNLQR